MRLQSGIFIEAGGGAAGREKPVDFMLSERAGEPAQQQMSARGDRDSAERHSEGELEERICGWAGVPEKSSFDFSSAVGCVLRDDQQSGAGIGGQLGAAPESACGEFGLGVRGLVKMNLAGGLVESGLPPDAPCIEEGALYGQDAVKAGEKQLWTLGTIF